MSFFDRVLFKLFRFTPTFSQAGEDKILQHLFFSRKLDKITYLDIGTNHPTIGSNTYLFYREGGSGVCVEPNPALCALIRSKRPRDLCINAGVSMGEEGIADFYSMNIHTLSTFSKDEAETLDRTTEYKIKEVLKTPLKNINNIIRDNFKTPIHLVSIDVEGWNEQIVESLDFSANRPLCFCVETITFSLENKGVKLQGIFDKFRDNDYSVYAETHLNTIFIDNRAV